MPSENANSHAGRYIGFAVEWLRDPNPNYEGWYWYSSLTDSMASNGPFNTSQAAYDDYKHQNDEGLEKEYNNAK